MVNATEPLVTASPSERNLDRLGFDPHAVLHAALADRAISRITWQETL